MGRFRLTATAVLLVAAGAALGQTHPGQLPALAPDAVFPRCSDSQIALAGFPDHRHAQHWSTWTTPRDADGNAYGPGAICDGQPLDRIAGLAMAPGEKRYRHFVLHHNPGYADCDMLAWIELLDWADHDVSALLGISTDDTLTMINPDNTPAYIEQAGQGVWRLYRIEGDTVILQPYPVLLARTLDGHAAFMLVTDWILRRALPGALPPWLHQGLVEYVGEDGVHLNNYMAEFRTGDKDVLLSPPLIDAILARGVDPDENVDRENFRRACYSAFLMVWQLVEYEGGLQPLQDFLAQAAAGADLDEAARLAWGMDLATLAGLVDPAVSGEPAGGRIPARKPHVQP